jgi:hypothetical protein
MSVPIRPMANGANLQPYRPAFQNSVKVIQDISLILSRDVVEVIKKNISIGVREFNNLFEKLLKVDDATVQ